MKRIFISGKISGEPVIDTVRRFQSVEFDMKISEPTEFINPLELPGIHFGISYEEAMNICLTALETCDTIYMLRDWQESKGARMEHERAKELGLKIMYQQ